MSIEELKTMAESVKKTGADVKLVGLWLWASFSTKPSKETREKLKNSGWKYASRKQKWFFAGQPAARWKGATYEMIAAKHGEEEI